MITNFNSIGVKRGNVGFSVVLLLLLVSVVFIAFMQLNQTYMKSSDVFLVSKKHTNTSLSSNRILVNEINQMFKEQFPRTNGVETDYKMPINSRSLSTILKKPNSVHISFYETLNNFSDNDFYREIILSDNELNSYSFIKEADCLSDLNESKCREFVITNVLLDDKEVSSVTLIKVKFLFSLTKNQNGTFNTLYKGFEVNKEINDLNEIRDHW